MPGIPTPILGLTVPTVGGDTGTWGNELNTDLGIIDSLGALGIVNVSSNYSAAVGVCPETLIRVTTGTGTVTITLPAPSTCTGRIWTVKKIDSGVGTVSIVASGGALIDGGASFVRTMQYGYARIVSNGVTYDVIANN